MTKLDLEKAKDAVDLVTASMFSLDFLEVITDVIFSPKRHEVTVGRFYDQWLQASGAKEPKIPFSLGAILGYLYCGLLFTKEHWFDLLPDVDFTTADPKWGISGANFEAPKKANPCLKNVVKRIRNALGHGYFTVNIPKRISRSERMTHVTLKFHDENIRDPSDTFDIELSLEQLSKFVKTFHSVIHRHVRSKT